MRKLFAEDMIGVKESLYIADKLVQKFLPQLHSHMKNEQVDVSMFATQWIMTVFTSTFRFDLVSRLWDCFLVEGWKVVYRVLLSLLQTAQDELLELDMEDMLTYLRDEFPARVDGQTVMRESLGIPLRQKHIRKYANEWRNSHERRDSNQDESVDSGSSSALPLRLQGVSVNGKHIAKKLLPGLARKESY